MYNKIIAKQKLIIGHNAVNTTKNFKSKFFLKSVG